ncbi:Peptidoglycan/xylan/chitin deacetylase, PgdA/CDA1 family [Caminicella sporogenes DSM 14501]|uniref:Peptidoglycan/xylan/chitin deacetylase, PgdA/CDA1 family n=1 Tax=Caminicella sporogenes DSM 14501 TaxID=1121266 RepID=A0A1M6L7E3_9FIRM|nr:polysaccharide deacetylase family protein [Caminicella sporogenes]RKD27734.1 hypothetical protein BET04_01325 [Caminicella sporogenes]SHJ67168.1 Peptidoglycan/xylan/chitin deacetylase, PgdA/CDA1 family [Caminicella sporogenes DSM 14501]
MKSKYKILLFLFVIFLTLTVLIKINIFSYKQVFKEDKLVPIRQGYNDKFIAFTCNVDWGTENIPKMLDIFEKYNIKITFFVSGRWAKNNPDMLKLIYQKGHEIGNHGYAHKMHSKLDFDGNYKEIKKTHDIVKNILGIDMKYFAPPAGDFSDITLKAADSLGYKTILWNIDTIDWRKDSTREKIIHRVLKKPLNASIVLMHPKEETIKALEEIIKSIKSKDINIGSVSDVLKLD